MSKKDNKVSMFYGRARRIELAEKIAYIVVGLVAVILVILLVTSQEDNSDTNINFAYLKQYFYELGYNCDFLHKSGGRCFKDTGTTEYGFVRNEDGFEYSVETNSYVLIIRHSLVNSSIISFSTTSEAFVGYKNKNYECEIKRNVLNKFGDCITSEGEVLNLNSYKGVIELAQKDIENIIESSGYYRESLLNDYKWKKK